MKRDSSHDSSHSLLWRIVPVLAISLIAILLTAGSLRALTSDAATHGAALPAGPQAVPPSLQAATVISQNVELIAQLGGWMNTVAVQNNKAYVGIGPSLVILDIANPAHPVELGRSRPMPDIVSKVFVSGTFAYIADHNAGLRILDVSDAANPVEIGSYTGSLFQSECVAVAGNYAYAGGLTDLRIIDVTNPTNPLAVGTFETPRTPFGVAVSGHYAYVGVDRKGVWVLDVSDPAAPHQVGSTVSGYPFDMQVTDDFLYVTDYFAGLRIIDIVSPTNAINISSFKTSGPGWGVAVAGTLAYVADLYGLSIIDISKPATPTLTAYYSMTGGTVAVAAAGNLVYVAARQGGLHVIDVADPYHPREIGFYQTPLVSPSRLAVAGAFAYIAEDNPDGEGPQGLRIVNVSDPPHPFTVSSVDTPGKAQDVAVNGPYVYVADDIAGLRVVNALYATHPFEISSEDTPGNALGVALSGNYAYVADGPSGLSIIKIKDPANPSQAGVYNPTSHAQDVAIVGSIAYIANGSMGLLIVNVANPSYPTELGRYALADARAVAVASNYAYVADGSGGLHVIAVSDPTHPTEAGSISTPGSAYDVAVSPDGLAYVADGYDGLHVINVSDPAHPIEVGFYETRGNATGVAVTGGLAYVACEYGSGLTILRYHPTAPTPSFLAVPTSGKRPLTVAFTDTSSGGVDTWLWNFGDGITSSLPNPTHTYTAVGVYTVSLSVQNTNGSHTLTRPNLITVTGMAAFTAEPTWGRPPLTVTFTNQSSGNYTSSLWNFGDGVASTLANPTHTFTAQGDFTVTLTVHSPDGDDTEVKPTFIHVGVQTLYVPLVMRSFTPGAIGLRFVAPGGTDDGNDCHNRMIPCATIQHTVDVAAPGDEIRVSSATYADMSVRPRQDVTTTGFVTQVAYISKTVTIRGGFTTANWEMPDPKVHHTILDARGQGRVIYISGDANPVIEGLRLANGNALGLGGLCTDSTCYDAGGGIYAITATATISGCEFENNAGNYVGGGAYLANSHATFNDNTFSGNTAGDGAGMYLNNSAATLRDNLIYSNTATFRGGGIYLASSPATVTGNRILSNTSMTVDGGGLYLSLSHATLISNTIQGNRSDGTDKFASGGGGIYLSSSNATLSGNTIQSNTARLSGGGMFVSSDASTLIGNTIADNTAGGSGGGGMYLNSSNVTLDHNTISGNQASTGGGIFMDHSAPTLTHDVIHHNAATEDGGGVYAWYGDITSNGNRVYSNIAHNMGGGLNLNGGNSLFTNTVIADNQAYSGGAAYVYMMATNVSFVHTTIARNTTAGQGDGSALYITGYQYFQPGPSQVVLTNTILVSHSVGISITGEYSVTGNGILWFGTPITISKAAYAIVTMQNQVGGDPDFAADGYHLTAGSAAIDRGVDAGVATDIDGIPRPQGTLPDLGAVEYIVPSQKASP